MTTQHEPILSESDFEALDAAIQGIDDLAENFARAKAAEIDVADAEKRAGELKRRLIGIKRAFAPDRP